MTTQADQELTLREIIVTSGHRLDHPWLNEIAQKAPSPKDADEHVMMSLGLPPVIGKDMRSLVRMRAQFSAAWNSLIVTTSRPAYSVCVFGDEAGPAGSALLQDARRYGDITFDLQTAPLLIRDFRIHGTQWTSFDGTGKLKPCLMEMSWPRWRRFPFAYGGRPVVLDFRDNEWVLSTDGSIRSFPDLVVTLGHAFSVLPNKIPVFWKVIELKKPAARSEPYGWERIRLIIREDQVVARPDAGHMTYEYVMLGARTDQGYNTFTVGGDFRVASSGGAWLARFMTGGCGDANFTPRIRLGVEEVGVSGIRNCPVSQIMARGGSILERLVTARSTIDLQGVIGLQLIKSPPACLLDLLT